MIPNSLSATSLDVFMNCPARFHAEKILKTPTPSGDAALRGSTVHLALELFVQKAIIEGTMPWVWEVLETFLLKAYKETFGSTDTDTEQFKDCVDMCKRWFARTDVRTVKVLSLEKRDEFDLITSIGKIPFVFIIDRLDELSPGVYRVVDYKSIRAYISPDDLRSKIQARIYALAIQILYPDAQEIWVEFDMVRHDTPNPGTKFTPQDNAATWYRLVEEAEKIIALDETDPINNPLPENINNECMYCVRKSSCNTFLRHEAGGGIYAKTGDEAVKLKLEIQSRLKAMRILDEELNDIILREADERGEFTWKVSDIEVKITAPKQRKPDMPAILRIMPPEIVERYGSMTLGTIDTLLKSGELTDEQVTQVKACIKQEWGDPKPKVTRKPII